MIIWSENEDYFVGSCSQLPRILFSHSEVDTLPTSNLGKEDCANVLFNSLLFNLRESTSVLDPGLASAPSLNQAASSASLLWQLPDLVQIIIYHLEHVHWWSGVNICSKNSPFANMGYFETVIRAQLEMFKQSAYFKIFTSQIKNSETNYWVHLGSKTVCPGQENSFLFTPVMVVVIKIMASSASCDWDWGWWSW